MSIDAGERFGVAGGGIFADPDFSDLSRLDLARPDHLAGSPPKLSNWEIGNLLSLADPCLHTASREGWRTNDTPSDRTVTLL
jgi:hypothetical protein